MYIKKNNFQTNSKENLPGFRESPSKNINCEIFKNSKIENYYVDNIKQCIHRERRKHIPSLPKTLVEVIEI